MDIANLLEKDKIQQVLLRYATVLDERDWPALSEIFLSESLAHYEGLGLFDGLPVIQRVIREFLEACGNTQHLIGNIRIDVRGNRASARSYLLGTYPGLGCYLGKTLMVWGENVDEFELHAQGWRIARRRTSLRHVTGDIGLTIKGVSPLIESQM